MAYIRHFGFAAHFRSEASSHVIHYRSGRKAKSGKGLSFWFLPQGASIAQLPVDDREMSLLSKDAQKIFRKYRCKDRSAGTSLTRILRQSA